MTALEGNKMAKRGRGAAALATAAIGSFVAGTIGTLGLTFAAPAMADIAIEYFQSPEYLALIVLAFTTVATLLGGSMVRGLASLFIGLAIGLVGIDGLTGQPRFTFGNQHLLAGVDVVTVAVGLFAVGETFWVASHMRKGKVDTEKVTGSKWMTKQDWKRSWKPWLRGAGFGFPIGTLPAGGAEIPTFLSYTVEKRLSNHPEEFGKGAIEGVAGPEAANNASAAGVLVPLLTLGLPTSATAAIMLAAFQRYNLNPGPQLFDQNPDLVWGLIASLYIGNLMLLVLNLPLVGMWVKLLSIPRPLLYSGILVFAGLGTWAQSQSVTGLVVLYVIGALGYLMRRFDIPVAPCIVAVILGPMAEIHFRRAMQISQGDWTALFTRPVAGTIYVIAALALFAPPIWRYVQSRRNRQATLAWSGG
jgi:putative tricarboxylic transport membrane protein